MPKGVYPRTANQLKVSVANLAKGHSPTSRKKALASIKANAAKPEWREKMRRIGTELAQNPETRNNQLQGLARHYGHSYGKNPKAPKTKQKSLILLGETYVDRFWSRVRIEGEDDCWIFLGSKKHNYGGFWNGVEENVASRFVLEMKLGRKLIGKEQALHHCDNPPCCNPKHIFLGDCQINAQDKMKKGRENPPRGDDHPMCKLTSKDVLDIRRLAALGKSSSQIAKKHPITPASIRKIVRRDSWKHL